MYHFCYLTFFSTILSSSPADAGPSNQAVTTDIKKRNFFKLDNLPRIVDRYKVSDRVDAAIASATLVDAGLVNKSD